MTFHQNHFALSPDQPKYLDVKKFHKFYKQFQWHNLTSEQRSDRLSGAKLEGGCDTPPKLDWQGKSSGSAGLMIWIGRAMKYFK
jgi:hypothetical protein